MRITPNWATITQSQVCERNSDQPSRRSRSMLLSWTRSCAVTRRLSISGTVPSMPVPHVSSAQPGPNAVTASPASAAPAIWPPFMAIRLIALACCSSPPGTSRGSSAWEAG